jgi:hypothetical protein
MLPGCCIMLCFQSTRQNIFTFFFIFPHSSFGIIRYCLVLIWVFVPKTIRRPFRFCLLKIVLYRSTSRSHSSIAFISTLSYTVAIHDVDFNLVSLQCLLHNGPVTYYFQGICLLNSGHFTIADVEFLTCVDTKRDVTFPETSMSEFWNNFKKKRTHFLTMKMTE